MDGGRAAWRPCTTWTSRCDTRTACGFSIRKADPFLRVIVGGPEDLLLSGAVERVFSSRSVRYDLLDGTGAAQRRSYSGPYREGDGRTPRVCAPDRQPRRRRSDRQTGGAHVARALRFEEVWILEGPDGRESLGSLDEVAASSKALPQRRRTNPDKGDLPGAHFTSVSRNETGIRTRSGSFGAKVHRSTATCGRSSSDRTRWTSRP